MIAPRHPMSYRASSSSTMPCRGLRRVVFPYSEGMLQKVQLSGQPRVIWTSMVL